MPCVSAEVTRPAVSSAKGSVLYWELNVAVPKTRGGRMDDSGVRRPLAKEYGMGFWRVGRLLTVEGGSMGVVAMVAIVRAAGNAIGGPTTVASLLRCL